MSTANPTTSSTDIQSNTNYPAEVFFDIETLLNVAQPQRILLLSDSNADFLNNYIEQKRVLNQECTVTQLKSSQIMSVLKLEQRFDVAIALDWFEHLDKSSGQQTLSRLRDIMSSQYCICLPMTKSQDENGWHLTDLFSFALSKVANYSANKQYFGLFKYNIHDYKKTPDWLNSDNWANPNMWGKYWW